MTPAQFTDHYRDHGRKLYYFVLGMSRNREEAEDITARAFVKAWEHRDQLNGNFKSWLYQIAVNEVKMSRRKASYIMEPLDTHLDIPEPKKEDFTGEWQRAAQSVFCLPVMLRRAMEEAIAGVSLRMSARAQGIPYGTAGRRLYSARQKVRELCQA